MGNDDPWPFGVEARRDDPLTARRIAVTHQWAGWPFLVAFDYDSAERPTEREAAMLASYLAEWKQRWYNTSWIARMERRLLDVDGATNGVIFRKWADGDWSYKRRRWSEYSGGGPRNRRMHRSSLTLVDAMDPLHSEATEGPWTEWKHTHPEVFGS
ncbi:hypothetical protein I0C86_41175 [Plantactinospora sp. S1510]|uniref:Uncharacterized protein n=1 Tax=Plantactinospora alkalitolerans TaxID=2789879 RepID=A0ABS0H9X3_9ACTN|nr:hypothetical protein [Plantactinospora alkalitolerans]MBF9135265.1 hypothetical protein [Plantactinospora alkalitolerans]